jgi:lysophospholipase L1-like esterase
MRFLQARWPRLVLKIGLGGVATVLALGLCELGARVILPAPPDPTREPQIVQRYDPEIRYTLVPDQRGWIDDGFVTINSLGFRGRETKTPKPAGVYRIVTIGDSLTLGWGVNDDETFSAQLERQLQSHFPHRPIDVVNLGVSGYDTRQEVALLKRNLSQLDPDLVLVGFYSNDVPDGLEDEESGGGTTRIAIAHASAGQILHMNPRPSSWWEAALRHSRVAYTVGRALNRFMNRGEWGSSHFAMELDLLHGRDSPELDKAWAGVERQLSELQSLAESHFAVGIVVLPCREQVTGEFNQARYQSRVREIAERVGFFVIDPLPALVAHRKDARDLFIAYDRNHPSAAGHRIIGETIADYLEKHEAAVSNAHRKESGALLSEK